MYIQFSGNQVFLQIWKVRFSFKGKELEESPLILCNFKGLDHIYIPRTGLIPVAGPFKDDL